MKRMVCRCVDDTDRSYETLGHRRGESTPEGPAVEEAYRLFAHLIIDESDPEIKRKLLDGFMKILANIDPEFDKDDFMDYVTELERKERRRKIREAKDRMYL